MRAIRYQSVLRILVHIAFWVILIMVLNSPAMNLDWGPFSQEAGTFLTPLIYGMIFNAALFYVNGYRMIPGFLHKKAYKAFWGWSILLLFGFSLIEVVLDLIYFLRYVGFESPDVIGEDLTESEDSGIVLDLIIWISSTFLINLFFWAMAFLYRFPKDWIHNERARQQLIQDKLTAELDFLKAQINPHFLFNGINSIYHLIGMDDEGARSVLLRFSDLLRYQLYDCQAELISLEKELNYVQNYILLEEVRKGEDAVIHKKLPSTQDLSALNGLKIAPLLLTPFLENAFKYLSLFSQKEENRLSIEIQLEGEELHFEVENTIDPSAEKRKNAKASGIGLENVKRRLALLYPDKHSLTIREDDGVFNVALQIQLS